MNKEKGQDSEKKNLLTKTIWLEGEDSSRRLMLSCHLLYWHCPALRYFHPVNDPVDHEHLPEDLLLQCFFLVSHFHSIKCSSQYPVCRMKVLQIKINSLWNSFSVKLGISLKFRNHCLSNWSNATKRYLSIVRIYSLPTWLPHSQKKLKMKKKVYPLKMIEKRKWKGNHLEYYKNILKDALRKKKLNSFGS